MAQVYRQNPNADNSSKKYIREGRERARNFLLSSFFVLTALFGFAMLVLWATAFFTMKNFLIALGVYVFFLIVFIGASVSISRTATASDIAGAEGELHAERLLAQLPMSYSVFRNSYITWNGESSEIDNIVIGPTGVFVIEVKNQKGTVFGNIDDKKWYLQKVGRGGTVYRGNDFYNPVKQVGTHVFRLARLIRDAGFNNVYIDGMVFFTNPECKLILKGESEKIPIYTFSENGPHALLSAIVDGKHKLKSDTVKGLCDLMIKRGNWC